MLHIFKCDQCGYTKEAERLSDDYCCPLCDEPAEGFVVAEPGSVPRHLINEPADPVADQN